MPLAYMESTPHMAGKAREYSRHYRRMALVEVESADARPRMISPRAKGVIRVVEDVTLCVGTTERSEGYRRRAEMRARADVCFD